MIRSPVLSAVLLIAPFLRAAAAAPAGVADIAAPVTGWTLPAAVRAVALMNPALALPAGVSFQGAAALPPQSPVWSAAARAIAASPALNLSAPEMVKAALESAAEVSGRRLSRALKAADRGAPPREGLAELADFGAFLPEKERSALEAALARHGVAAARARELEGDGAAALAAPDADPALLVAQYGVQHKKDLIRTVQEYDALIAPRRAALYSRPNDSYASSRALVPHAATLFPLLRRDRALSALIGDLRERDGRVIWADAGGGLGAALRDWSREGLGPDVERIVVDLFDWEKLSMSRLSDAIDYYDGINLDGASLFAPRHRPKVRLADLASVRFPEDARPNLITSIESVQYWPDKIRVLVNLYNQLRDGGVLAVAAEHKWATWIRTEGSIVSHTSTVFDDMIAALAGAGVEIAAAVESPGSPVEDLRSLVIRKKPGTRLAQNARLKDVWVNPHGYSASYYRALPEGRASVDVVNEP